MSNRVEGGQRSGTVRRANLSGILRELDAAGPLSRSELGARTGLTRSAIGRLVGELAAGGLVREGRPELLGLPGRPSPQVDLDPSGAVVLALEIAVDSVASAAVGLGGDVLALDRIELPAGRSAVEDVIDDLVAIARSQQDRWRTDRCAGVGVAVVGPVRKSDGLVAMAPNLGWRNVGLGRRVALALDIDVPISVANEADLGALAEHRRGAAVGFDDVIFISGEVGVGGGIIVGGRPLDGATGYGGEVGHVPVNPVAGVACRCGSVGCWETEVGEGVLLARAGYPADGGPSAVEAVLVEAAAGTESAVAAVREVGRWLGIGLAGLVNVFDPAIVVLGGRFAGLHPHVARTIETEIDRRALPVRRAPIRVVPAALGVDAPLLGAAELAMEPILADPAAWLLQTGGPRGTNGTVTAGERDLGPASAGRQLASERPSATAQRSSIARRTAVAQMFDSEGRAVPRLRMR